MTDIFRNKVIRMAYENPELRPKLLPLLKESSSGLSPLVKEVLEKASYNVAGHFLSELSDDIYNQVVFPEGIQADLGGVVIVCHPLHPPRILTPRSPPKVSRSYPLAPEKERQRVSSDNTDWNRFSDREIETGSEERNSTRKGLERTPADQNRDTLLPWCILSSVLSTGAVLRLRA
jgi:hypothetical protein